jgi:hypothetical protein
VEARVLARFEAKTEPEPNTGCWLWTGALNYAGYGVFCRDGRKHRAHHVGYEHYIGPVPDGFQLDHRCRVRSCVNPDHLRAVTSRQNTLAPGSASPTAQNAAKTRCLHGHPLVGDNLMLKRGRRECRECNRARCRRYYQRGRCRG